MGRRVLALGLIATVLFSAVASAQSVIGSPDFVAGYLEGESHGKLDAPLSNIVWGWLFGLVDVLVVAVSDTDIPYSRIVPLEAHPDAYKRGYVEGYKDGRSERRLAYSAVGWGLWVGTVLVLLGYGY